MKKLAILLLAIVLAACGAPVAPTEQAVAPASAEPVVVTVVVEPTQAPVEPTAPAPAEPIVVTVVVEATQVPEAAAPPAEAPVQSSDDTALKLDEVLGKGVFTNMTVSDSNLTLRCAPRFVTFNVTALNTAITDVLFYYRITDLNRQYPKEYKNFGKMTAVGNGNFALDFSGENVHPDVRIDGAWLDFQFVGLAKSGDVVDRSQVIESFIKYTLDCP